MDLLLTCLYDFDRTRPGDYPALSEVHAAIKAAVPEQWILDAASVLNSRGLIEWLPEIGGYGYARLSGQGRLYVEDGTPTIKRAREAPNHFFVTGDHAQIVVAGDYGTVTQNQSVDSRRQPAFRIIDDLAKKLGADSSLGDDEKSELKVDLETVRSQLMKRSPNMTVVANLLSGLRNVASVASDVAKLVALLNV